MLEPDDTTDSPVEVMTVAHGPESIDLLEDDTFSPPPSPAGQKPVGFAPELPSSDTDSAVQKIRQTLEATGDLKPQPAETFMVPPAELEEAKIDAEDLDPIQDFEIPDDDSLDFDTNSSSMDLDKDLLDDLDDE
jgi:hypothetical protein